MIDLKLLVAEYRKNNPEPKEKLRELFKSFYKDPMFQELLGQKKNSPWRCWARDNKSQCDDFTSRFVNQLAKTMNKEYGVDNSKLAVLSNNRQASLVIKPRKVK
jgi:hypothetical protein